MQSRRDRPSSSAENIMDYMESFTDLQVRAMYKVFSYLSLSELREAHSAGGGVGKKHHFYL